jgi:hypothetical protein
MADNLSDLDVHHAFDWVGDNKVVPSAMLVAVASAVLKVALFIEQ